MGVALVPLLSWSITTHVQIARSKNHFVASYKQIAVRLSSFQYVAEYVYRGVGLGCFDGEGGLGHSAVGTEHVHGHGTQHADIDNKM